MLIYKNTAIGFRTDVDDNSIVDIIRNNFIQKTGRYPTQEVGAWTNSLRAMEPIVRRSKIPDDCGVLIEYKIPLTNRRIDFVLTGEDEDSKRNFVVVELKQWETASATHMDGVVGTPYHGEDPHPSYQAYSYKVIVREYNENVLKKKIRLSSCAYLHNYTEQNPEPLKTEIYSEYVNDTPLYFRGDEEKLQKFICQHVGKGKGMEILYFIENGNIKPSEKLIDHICSMYKGNPYFTLVDKQKVAYEKALDLAGRVDGKTVLIIKGGPGTGKSVISVNLIGGLLQKESNIVFVAPNAAFRTVMIDRLASEEENKKVFLKILFKGSSGFVDIENNTYDVAVIDEAHRLKNASAYGYYGESQVQDILKAARCCIFFIDDNQRVRPEDIGSVDTIKKEAESIGAAIYEIELEAQFRCSGAKEYINWLDHVLKIRDVADNDICWNNKDFDFRIFDDPTKLLREIGARREEGYESRIIAGYAWNWTTNQNDNAQINDVVIEEYNFAMPWNSRNNRTIWALDKDGNEQVGCIHTCQGLEFDYVGVLVGKELLFEEGKYSVDWMSYKDAKGKQKLRGTPQELSMYVRNIYKVLMSRGMKGCYVFFLNEEVKKHFIESMPKNMLSFDNSVVTDLEELVPYKNALPLIFLRSVALAFYEKIDGYFPLDLEIYDELYPIEDGPFAEDRFLVRIEGDSMEPDIPDGSVCRFRIDPGGSRNGKTVLCVIPDSLGGGSIAVVKRYHSVRKPTIDSIGWAEHIVLSSNNPEHSPVVLTESDDMRIVGIFEEVVAPTTERKTDT